MSGRVQANPGLKLDEQQIRDFIARVKTQARELVAEGVDRDELEAHIRALEDALARRAPAAEIAAALDALEATLLAVSDGGVSANMLNFLNQLFGTGMPPV
jgi:hypothetical protein